MTMRARPRNWQYSIHSIPNDNHSDLKRTSSIMISKSYTKFTTFPTGHYSVFFMEDFLSSKQRIVWRNYRAIPRGEHYEFCDIKSAVIDFTQGASLSACPDFVTDGEHAHSPFTKNVPNCELVYKQTAHLFIHDAYYYIHLLARPGG